MQLTHTFFLFSQNIFEGKMKSSTKVLLVLFFLTFIPALVLIKYVFEGINFSNNHFYYVFNGYNIAGLVLLGVNIFLGAWLYIRFLKSLKLSKAIFFASFPITIIYSAGLFLIATALNLQNELAIFLQTILKINGFYNALLWAVLWTLVYLLVMFVLYAYLCRPVQRVEKLALRLSDGRVREENFNIGTSKQFKDIEASFEKINYNYKEKENMVKQTDLEAQKFIPKQFLKFLGKSSITDLELGNQVQKHATTFFCDIVSSTKVSSSLSLEENFNFINSYLNVVSPIIRKHDGFIDKYLGDGILAVFPRPENAIECATAVCRAIEIKNRSQKSLPDVDARISIHTGEIIFGVVGEEERKSPTIISDVVNLASKMEEINVLMGTKIIFSKETLNELPAKYEFAYRYIGLITTSGETTALFECLENYPRKKRERLLHLKRVFEEGVRQFHDGKFLQARSSFKEVLRYVSDDKASYVYFNKACDKIEEDIS